MESMIGQVAQALHDCTIANKGLSRGASDMRDDARAILRAIRIPTREMVQEGERFGTTERGYTAMIDAALSELE